MPEHLTSESGSGYLATPTSTANQLAPSMRKHPGCLGWMIGTRTASMTERSEKFKRSTLTPAEFVRRWPTPVADGDRTTNYTPQRSEVVGGKLNPPWVEWLMGWPIGWTDLKPLVTDKFRQWLHSHGKPSCAD